MQDMCTRRCVYCEMVGWDISFVYYLLPQLEHRVCACVCTRARTFPSGKKFKHLNIPARRSIDPRVTAISQLCESSSSSRWSVRESES